MYKFQHISRGAWLYCSLIAVFLTASATGARADQGQIQASLLFDKASFQAGRDSSRSVGKVGVLLKVKKDWHTYWRNSGEAAIPTKVQWEVPPGWKVGELEWPVPERFQERGDITTYGYENEVLLSAEVFSPDVVPSSDQNIRFGAKVNWLVCNEICVPGSAKIEKEIPFSGSLPEQVSPEYSLFEKYALLLPQAFTAANESGVSYAISGKRTPNSAHIYFELSGLENLSAEELAKNIQVFPLSQTPIRPIPQAEVKVIDVVGGKKILIHLSYTQARLLDDAKEARLTGILALSPLTNRSKQVFSFPWEFQASQLQKQDAELVSDPSFLPLQYRVVNHSGSSEGERVVAEDVTAESKVVAAPKSAPLTQQKKDETGLLFALVFAFIGGLILNLMPCVLPIISIKIMGFVEAGGQTRKAALTSSLFFAAGILASVLSLAISIISLRSLGYSLGWGFQFQHPSFVFFLACIVFILSLSFFDLYSIELPGMNKANKFAGALTSPQAKSFFDGVLATALSTPCTAPFLGTALVFAFSQPAWATILIFISIGIGLALPYVLLASSPRLARLLPKPGNWMFRFRQFLGFLLLGTVLWLIFVLHALTNVGALWGALFLLMVFFVLWLIRGFGDQKIRAGWGRLGLAAVILGFSLFKTYPHVIHGDKADKISGTAIPWRDFSEEVLQSSLNEGKTVFIDFTASWCITCKTNELVVIDTEETSAKLREAGIVALRADWTAGDEAITQALNRYGAEGVPLYVVVKPGSEKPSVLSGIISKSALYAAFAGGAS